jgi:hypothetical protein
MPRINFALIAKTLGIALPVFIFIYPSIDLTQMADVIASLYDVVLYAFGAPLVFLVDNVYNVFPDTIDVSTASDVFIITSSLLFFFVAPSSFLSLLIHNTIGYKQRSITYVFNFFVVLILAFLTVTFITGGLLSDFATIALGLILFIVIGNYLLIKLTGALIRRDVLKQINVLLFLGLFIPFTWSIYFPYHFQVIQTKAITAATELVQKMRSPNLNDLTLSQFNELTGQINSYVKSAYYISNRWRNVVQQNQFTLTDSTKDYTKAMTSPDYASEKMRVDDVTKERRDIMGSLAFQAIINEIGTVCNNSVNMFELAYTQNPQSEESQPESYKLIFIGEKLIQKNQLLNPDTISMTDQKNVRVCDQEISPLAQTIFLDTEEYSDWYENFIEDLETLPEQERINAILESYVETLDVKWVDTRDRSVKFELNI